MVDRVATPDEIEHRCSGARKQLKVLAEKVPEEYEAEVRDLVGRVGTLEERLKKATDEEETEVVPGVE